MYSRTFDAGMLQALRVAANKLLAVCLHARVLEAADKAFTLASTSLMLSNFPLILFDII